MRKELCRNLYVNFMCDHWETGRACCNVHENSKWSQKCGASWRCIYIRNKFLYNQSFIPHKLVHRMCLWTVPQVKEQRGNKNQNELVMAVIKYGGGLLFTTCNKTASAAIYGDACPTELNHFCQGHVNNLCGAFWIYWQMDILSNRALQTGKQVLKKAIVSCLYGILVATWVPPEAFLHLWDPPTLLPCAENFLCLPILQSLNRPHTKQVFFLAMVKPY